MNEAIVVELRFFFTSVFWGILLLIFYDVLRIFRRILIHNGLFVALEDLIYWVISSILIFRMMYKQNNGIIRGFSILAMLFGMIIYHATVSDLLVDTISGLFGKIIALVRKVIGIILFPIKWIMRRINRIFVWVFHKIKKFMYFVLKILKKNPISSKMTVAGRKEKPSEK